MRAIDDFHAVSSTPGGVLLATLLAAWNEARFFGSWLVGSVGSS